MGFSHNFKPPMSACVGQVGYHMCLGRNAILSHVLSRGRSTRTIPLPNEVMATQWRSIAVCISLPSTACDVALSLPGSVLT